MSCIESSKNQIPSGTLRLMTEIVSYPILLEHEESMSLSAQESSMYDVSSWMLYLSQIDEILSSLEDAIKESLQKKRNQGSYSTTTIGGRTLKVQELGEHHRFMQQSRNLISERAVTLLPGSYKLWNDYLSFRSNVYFPRSYVITSSERSSRYKSTISAFERSLVRMNKYPRIWLKYISFVVHNDPSCSVTNVRRLFNRALLALPATQHDLIWTEYLAFILQRIPPKGLFTGGIKDVGPVTLSLQNGTLEDERYPWNIPHETALRVLRRYAHYYNPTARELLADVALEFGRYGEAAVLYCEILNDMDFLSANGTTRHELWIKFTDVCTEHPEDTRESGVDFEGIVRGVLNPQGEGEGDGGTIGRGWKVFDDTKKDDEEEGGVDEAERQEKIREQQAQLQATLGELEGTLWNKLSLYYIRSGEFEVVRSIYEEAMESVSRVRDFSLIFDSYVKFEENVIEVMMENMNEEEEEGIKETSSTLEVTNNSAIDEEDFDILLGKRSKIADEDTSEQNTTADIELAIARAENLMRRRPLLLNHVLLKQNPQNVAEWLKRSNLYLESDQSSQAIASLEEGIKKLSSKLAMNGSPADLYKALATLYENRLNDYSKARSVFERICCPTPEYRFRDSDDLAQCYAAWVEMELRHEHWDQALSVARRSVANVPAGTPKVVRGLVKSLRLWNLLLDLEESLGTLQTTKDAYNRLLELKVAIPTQVLNFASYLAENKYFEESFSAFERGIDMFPFPHPGAKMLWKEYLQAFETRYEGAKVHRMRELFDRCLENCPVEDCSTFFLLYGKFEEKFGLTKRALGVYEKMCTTIPANEKLSAYQLYIAKTIKYIGITATRPIYERAIAALDDTPAAKMCLDYAKMEASLNEIDRARAAFTYGAQLADPRTNPEYWGEWHEFEVSHGNEETFREMLRVKRGVQAAFSTINYSIADLETTSKVEAPLSHEEAIAMLAAQEGEELDQTEIEKKGGFIKAKRPPEIKDLGEVERRAAKLRKITSGLVSSTEEKTNNLNDEEIDIDDN